MQQPASGGDPLSRVLELLAGRGLQVRNAANGYMAQCPAHADGSPSLSVKPGEDGRVLLHCFAGCETDAIATALGLQMTDLFPPPSAAGAAGSQATEFYYSILDVEGNEVARHCRRNNGDGTKEMWWCGPDGSKGLHGKKVRDLPLFGTEHLKAAPIDCAAIICEGEKDATALQRRGYLALGTVTGAGGKAAKAPSPDVFAPLRDRDVILWPDNDPIGRQHMILVARHLRGVAKSVRMVEWPDAAEKCGAADFAGTEEQLNAMLDAAKVPAVEPDPANMLILDRSRTMPTAEKFVEEFYDHPDGRTLHAHAGELWAWRGNCYRMIDQAEIRHQLQPWMHSAVYEHLTKDGPEYAPFPANTRTIGDALAATRDLVLIPGEVSPPVWLGDDKPPAPVAELLPCSSGNLHVPTRRMMPPTPRLFATAALDFDFDPAAARPECWLQFLDDLFGPDAESIGLLQEWCGYCLTADTSQQKALALIGPRRSGKGTIGRVLTSLVGVANVAGPTTSSLAGQFGLQPLIGKSLAIISDARFSGEGVQTVIERLLCITGEDSLTVDRKHVGSVTLRLPTRFVLLSNELPRLPDSAQALAGRFLLLILRHSYYGQEDPTLTSRLLAELPSILVWALDGLDRLRDRGRFVEPAASQEAIQDLADLSSPVSAFVREQCQIGPDQRVLVDTLYALWRGWCEADGRHSPSTRQMFSRDLQAACPTIRTRKGTGDLRFFDGISMRSPASTT